MQKSSKKKPIKIGILGGTFDPPHVGHLHIAKVAIKKLRLNKLFWIVAKKNPFKLKPYLTTKVRIKLSREMTKKNKKILVKCLDNKIKLKNTFYLLKYIKNKNANIKLYFLIGSDNLIKFHKWHNWKKIPKLAKIVVFARQNYSIKARKSIASKKLEKKDLIYINSKKINISSSLIRKF